MSNVAMLHPSRELLLAYADGGLDAVQQDCVRGHLAECGECASWLRELEAGVAEYAHTWMPALKETLSPPPQPWFDLRKRLSDLDAAPLPLKVPLVSRGWMWPAWAVIAAGVVIGIIAAQWFSGQKVSAAELLSKASDHEAAEKRPRLPIHVRTRSGSLRRPAVWKRQEQTRLAAVAESIRARFEAANYSWEDPLSARSFAAWRRGLRDRRDHVVKVRGASGISAFEVRTATADGTLAEARLTLRASDLHAVREVLHFRDNELVEIIELPGVLPEAAPPVDSYAQQSGSAPAVEQPVTPGEELRVWAALHSIQADLGEPIEVALDAQGTSLVVTGLGLSPRRQRELEQVLAGLSRVHLRFSEPRPMRQPAERLTVTQNQPPPLQPRLESELGARGLADEFVNQVLESSEAALARAHAIRKLAERFPPETENRLDPPGRALLASLVTEHFTALEAAWRRTYEAMRQIVAVPSASPVAATQTWQAHAQSLVAATERVDRLLTQMLAVRGAQAQEQALVEEMSRLEAEVLAAAAALRRTR